MVEGKKARRARLPIQVAVYPVRKSNSGWEFLMLHRVLPAMAFWQGVSGGVESDDPSIESAASRELLEETSFEPEQLIRLDYRYYFPVPQSMKHFFTEDVSLLVEHSFLAIVDPAAEVTIDRDEHDQHRWSNYDEAMAFLHWSGNRQSLRECQRRLADLSVKA